MSAPAEKLASLWDLALHQPQIDPEDLARAIERQLTEEQPDFRTKLLVRDSVKALRHRWGEQRTREWIASSPAREFIEKILDANLDDPGFRYLIHGVMEITKPETVERFLRELGTTLRSPASITIGGAIALIVPALLSRRTDDIDVVDEVPAAIRSEHALLDDLAKRHRLGLTHFQSHYLPAGWQSRVKSFGRFGQLDVSLVDEYDVMLGKVFSNRTKDRDDLRVLAPQLDKNVLIERLRSSAASFLSDPKLRDYAAKNWYIVYGEDLPA